MPRRLQLSLKKSIQVLAVVIFSLAAFATAHADPITVTGTATVVNGLNFGPAISFTLTGPNFSADVIDGGGIDRFFHFGIAPCSRSVGAFNGPCTGANLGYASQSDLRGPFTINGMTFNASVVNPLNFQIISPSFVIPPELLDDAAVLITAPFTFSGFAITELSGVPFTLQGQGTVQLLLTRQTAGSFTGLFLDHADYTFGPTVPGVTIESVPEPTTLVLLFTGLAGVAARVRRSSRRHR